MTLQSGKSMLAFTLIASVAVVTMMIQTADAAQCPLYNGKPRCYAVHTFYPSSPTYALGSQSTHKVFQNVVNNGAVNAPLWSWTTNTQPKLLEVGWQDLAGSSTVAQFYCAVDGTIQGSKWGNPTHNTFYTFQIDDTNQDNTWIMSAGGQSCSYSQEAQALNSTSLKWDTR